MYLIRVSSFWKEAAYSMVITSNGMRQDIQGLRAVAVIAVVAFHAGLQIPGGFLGVDLFFVISGFVITRMLKKEYETNGNISLKNFYIRRFRRLAPALGVFVAVTVLLSLFILSPFGQLQNTFWTALGTNFGLSNLAIFSTTSNYFDLPASTNPLLNTWSLAVEEQFYAFFPLVLIAFFIYAKSKARPNTWLAIALSFIFVISFLLFLYSTDVHSENLGFATSFYSPLPRAWEFIAGALLVLWNKPTFQLPNFVLFFLEGIAYFSVIAAFFLFQNAETNRLFPTIILVLATVVLIWAGNFDKSTSYKFLSQKPISIVGDYSYSIYLWHWPFIVFASVLWPGHQKIVIAAAIASFLPAIFSYLFIENRFRLTANTDAVSRFSIFSRKNLIIFSTPLAMTVACFTALNFVISPAFAEEDSGIYAGAIGHTSYHQYVDSHFYPCSNQQILRTSETWEKTIRCHQSKPGPDVEVVLLGDSHAEHLFVGLAEALPNKNVAYYIRGANQISKSDERLFALVEEIDHSSSIKTVVISAFWKVKSVDVAGLHDLVETLVESGKSVFVTDDFNDFPFPPENCKYNLSLVIRSNCETSSASFQAQLSINRPLLESALSGITGSELLSTSSYFCKSDTCSMVNEGRIMFRDGNHLNVDGSRYVVNRLIAENQSLRDQLFNH